MQTDPLILLADGRKPVLAALGHALRGAGYYVVVAQNGLDAVRMAGDLQPDAVLLGEAFPDFDAEAVSEFFSADWALKNMPQVLLPKLQNTLESAAFSLRPVVEEVARSLRTSLRSSMAAAG